MTSTVCAANGQPRSPSRKVQTTHAHIPIRTDLLEKDHDVLSILPDCDFERRESLARRKLDDRSVVVPRNPLRVLPHLCIEEKGIEASGWVVKDPKGDGGAGVGERSGPVALARDLATASDIVVQGRSGFR